MNDQVFEQYEGTLKELKTGDVVEGEVISVNSDFVVMNIGGKSDGIVKKDEFIQDLYEDLLKTAAVGDKYNVMILATNDGAGSYVLSKLRAEEQVAKADLQKVFEAGEIIDGKITKAIKGGLLVDIGGLTAFMPASYYDVRFVKDLQALEGKEIQGRIVEYNPGANRIIFSRKVLVIEEIEKRKAEQQQRKEEAVKDLEIGQEIDTVVKNLTDYGAFVDLGGIDGFIHVSDIAWAPVRKPADKLAQGQQVKAKIIELDKENYKVKLSIKELTPDPWQMFRKQFTEGDKVKATITTIAKYGAFARIIEDVEGLIHISQFAHEKISTPEAVVKTGEEVEVAIIKIDDEKKKVSLSIKELLPIPKKKIEKNKQVYADDATVTIGDLFGNIKID